MTINILLERVRNTFRRYPLSLIIICAILFLTFYKTDGEELPKMFPHFDKLAHFMMYFGFCIVLWFEYYRSHPDIVRSKLFWGAIIGPALFSGALEIAQAMMTTYRSGDIFDFMFNIAGVISAAFAGVFIIKPIIRKKV
ncbi:MAG: VanZ family protein [Bacteroidaceae bacterium]|nr:VanZ family protein [Bacteroidaceae bacterium]